MRGNEKRKKGVTGPQRGVTEEEIVFTRLLQGERDGFFGDQQCRRARARSTTGATPASIAGDGVRSHQRRDGEV
jgi:hypothetical protein